MGLESLIINQRQRNDQARGAIGRLAKKIRMGSIAEDFGKWPDKTPRGVQNFAIQNKLTPDESTEFMGMLSKFQEYAAKHGQEKRAKSEEVRRAKKFPITLSGLTQDQNIKLSDFDTRTEQTAYDKTQRKAKEEAEAQKIAESKARAGYYGRGGARSTKANPYDTADYKANLATIKNIRTQLTSGVLIGEDGVEVPLTPDDRKRLNAEIAEIRKMNRAIKEGKVYMPDAAVEEQPGSYVSELLKNSKGTKTSKRPTVNLGGRLSELTSSVPVRNKYADLIQVVK